MNYTHLINKENSIYNIKEMIPNINTKDLTFNGDTSHFNNILFTGDNELD